MERQICHKTGRSKSIFWHRFVFPSSYGCYFSKILQTWYSPRLHGIKILGPGTKIWAGQAGPKFYSSGAAAYILSFFCYFRGTPISSSQLGLLWRCRGAPGCSRSAPRTALDALRAVTSAAPKPILAKEARRYATHGQNRCQSWRFSNYF